MPVQDGGDRHAGAERSHGTRQLCRIPRDHGGKRNAVQVLHQRYIDGFPAMAPQGPCDHCILGLDGVMGRMAERPADLGDNETDDRFILSPFEVIRHRARDSNVDRSLADMFGVPAMSATSIFAIKKQTSAARAEAIATVVNSDPREPWVIWVDTNDEADAVKSAHARGRQRLEDHNRSTRRKKVEAFALGRRQFISLPSRRCAGLGSIGHTAHGWPLLAAHTVMRLGIKPSADAGGSVNKD